MHGAQGARGSFRIEPFRLKVATDPGFPERTWKVLDGAIDEIFRHNSSRLSFEELYRAAYNMVLHKCGAELYANVERKIQAHLEASAKKIIEQDGTGFMGEIVRQWKDHTTFAAVLRDVLMYMDRTFVPQHNLSPVFMLHMTLWRDTVVRNPSIKPRLIAAVLGSIERERKGSHEDRGRLMEITKMWAELGPEVYASDFEVPLLESSRRFYSDEASEGLKRCSCPEYLSLAARRLSEEAERCHAYMDPASEGKLLQVVRQEMIQAKVNEVVGMPGSGMSVMLAGGKAEQLSAMYSLLCQVPGGLKAMCDALQAHVTTGGDALMENEELQGNPEELVGRLLEERDRLERLCKEAMQADRILLQHLGQALKNVLNRNGRCPRSSEMLSVYVDGVLSGKGKAREMGEDEVERALDGAVALFRHLEDKDIFEANYREMLAKRLLGGRSGGEEMERGMLGRLKEECGNQYTAKLESMFWDTKTSRDLAAEFKQRCKDSPELAGPGPDMTVQVLTQGAWPSKGIGPCILPAELRGRAEAFEGFYLAAHGGRKLTWQTTMGTAEVRFHADSGAYDLVVSTQQMCILALFDEGTRLTAEEIHEATQMDRGEMERALLSMACVKGKNILRKEPQSGTVEATDTFTVNEGFEGKQKRIRIGTITAQREEEKGRAETIQQVEMHRRPLVEAAVMRVMKAKRRMEHNALVADVTQQLASHFAVQPVRVKQSIESLLEREYLERDEGDRRVYHYVT